MTESDVELNFYKSKSDKKTYRILTLNNGLEILLVSTSIVKRNKTVAIKSSSSDDTIQDHKSTLSTAGAAIQESSMKSAAALTVQVGSFADPEGCEGLAHFLEHMIFMGSKKYPGKFFFLIRIFNFLL